MNRFSYSWMCTYGSPDATSYFVSIGCLYSLQCWWFCILLENFDSSIFCCICADILYSCNSLSVTTFSSNCWDLSSTMVTTITPWDLPSFSCPCVWPLLFFLSFLLFRWLFLLTRCIPAEIGLASLCLPCFEVISIGLFEEELLPFCIQPVLSICCVYACTWDKRYAPFGVWCLLG